LQPEAAASCSVAAATPTVAEGQPKTTTAVVAPTATSTKDLQLSPIPVSSPSILTQVDDHTVTTTQLSDDSPTNMNFTQDDNVTAALAAAAAPVLSQSLTQTQTSVTVMKPMSPTRSVGRQPLNSSAKASTAATPTSQESLPKHQVFRNDPRFTPKSISAAVALARMSGTIVEKTANVIERNLTQTQTVKSPAVAPAISASVSLLIQLDQDGRKKVKTDVRKRGNKTTVLSTAATSLSVPVTTASDAAISSARPSSSSTISAIAKAKETTRPSAMAALPVTATTAAHVSVPVTSKAVTATTLDDTAQPPLPESLSMAAKATVNRSVQATTSTVAAAKSATARSSTLSSSAAGKRSIHDIFQLSSRKSYAPANQNAVQVMGIDQNGRILKKVRPSH
jgi:hypothetical protein